MEQEGEVQEEGFEFPSKCIFKQYYRIGVSEERSNNKRRTFFPQLFKNRIDYHLKRHEKTKRRQLIKELLNVATSGILQDNCQSLLTANLGV